MGSEGPRPGAGPQDEPVCGACGEPVGTVIRRRKVLGVFVPVWRPGPCRNAHCEVRVDDEAEAARAAGRTSGRRFRSRHGRRTVALPDPAGRGAPEAEAEVGPAAPRPVGVEDDEADKDDEHNKADKADKAE
ncbi:hypothetical protein [Streptomyces sp. WAC 01529]|uniref:hypothetical protein n=1 Tax=Streptomyces sp. WAC 01529 TaxID=2203205 RepID=UPI000F73F6B9|nr:hypothetical protein [Streptomyces sp. WAC 01529]